MSAETELPKKIKGVVSFMCNRCQRPCHCRCHCRGNRRRECRRECHRGCEELFSNERRNCRECHRGCEELFSNGRCGCGNVREELFLNGNCGCEHGRDVDIDVDIDVDVDIDFLNEEGFNFENGFNEGRRGCGCNGSEEVIVEPTVFCQSNSRHHHQNVRHIVPVLVRENHHHHRHHEYDFRTAYDRRHHNHEHGVMPRNQFCNAAGFENDRRCDFE